MQAVWIKNAIALCLIVESCNGNRFTGPSNTSVPEGTRATLECRTSPSKTVWWKYLENYVFYANTISHGYKSSHEANVDASKGIYNLIILNASSHAGLYTCVDDDGEGESRSAWLTVATNETPPNPSAENSTLTVALAVGIPVIIIIVIVLVIFCRRRLERRKHKASEDNLKPTVENNEAEPLTGSPSGEQTNTDNDEVTLEHTQEPQEDRRDDPTASTETRQNSTTTGVKEIEEPTTSSYVERNSQGASWVSSTQEDTLKKSIDGTSNPSEKDQAILEISQRKTGGRAMEDKPIERGPVAKPRMSKESETPLASTTPEEKQASGNDNVNTTEPKSTSESTNTTDNTQTDSLKPATRRGKTNREEQPPACSTSTETEKGEPTTTISNVANNPQTTSSVSSPQKGPVAKPSKPNEQETPLASTTPEEKEESGNDNVNTTEHESTIGSKNTTDNTQTDPLKPDSQKDEGSEVLPEPATITTTDVSNVVPEENSPKNEVTVSPGKPDSAAKKKPPVPPKPTKNSDTTKND